MNLFKKSMMAVLVSSLALTTVACSPKQKDASNSTTTTSKTEYITDINKDNVDEIVVEYKELLSYYNDLKSNLKTVSDVSKNSNLESDLASVKESLNSKSKLVKDAKIKYKPLADAQANLVEMYSLSQKMADSVVKDKKTYNKTVIEYNKKFKEYKKQMDQIRQDIEKIRSKNEESKDSKTDEESKNTDKTKDKESNNSSDGSKNSDSDTSVPKAAKSHTTTTKYRKEAEKTSGTTVPYVSSLTSELEGQITSAGASEGEAFKKSGGSKEEAKSKASELFDALENDSPIQKSDRAEAKALFVKAFMGAFN